MFEILFYMLVAHAFFDYAGQGDFMAQAKNKGNAFDGVPYYQPLTAHALIQSAPVYFFTGLWTLAIAEFVIHWLTDHTKCASKISYNTDQAIHIVCKIVWAVVAYNFSNKLI